jgi:hypothetical protein
MKIGSISELTASGARVSLVSPKILSAELKYIQTPIVGVQPKLDYKVGDMVLVTFIGTGYSHGYILGVVK